MGRDGREVWSKRVERWRESGLTAQEFAVETGLNKNTLVHWSWKLGRAGDVGPVLPSKKAQWVEVVGVASPDVADTPTENSGPIGGGGHFELILGKGRVVRVPTDFDAAALRRLLVALEA